MLYQFCVHHIDCYISQFLVVEVKNVSKKVVFKPDRGQFVKSKKNVSFYALSQHKSKQSTSTQVVKTLFFQIPHLIFYHKQLSGAKESLLCHYPMVIDYILEINLTKH